MANGSVQSTADVSVNLENCASITEIHQALDNGGGGRSVWGYAQVGRNTSNNFKNTVGDPNTGSSSAIANVYIETRQDNNAFIHCLVTGNNGIKHKYIFSNLDYPSNNKQTEWVSLYAEIITNAVTESLTVTTDSVGKVLLSDAQKPSLTGYVPIGANIANFSSDDLGSAYPPSVILTANGNFYIMGSPNKTYHSIQVMAIMRKT